MPIVYKATNKVNGKIYIGFSRNSLDTRRKQHEQRAEKDKGRKVSFHTAIKKHGKANFEWEVLKEFSDESKAKDYEAKCIYEQDSMNPEIGYNIYRSGGSKHTVESIEYKNMGGRPPLFKSVEDLDSKIDEYFNDTDIPTITGLCLFLGFCSRQSFYDYEKREGFSYSIKKARLGIENIYEQRLLGNSPTGAIFALKNFGWRDKAEIEHTTIDKNGETTGIRFE